MPSQSKASTHREGSLNPGKLFFLRAHNQVGRGLMLAHHLGDHLHQRGDVFPPDSPDKEAGYLAVAPVPVNHGGVGQKTALSPTAQHHAADHAHNFNDVFIQKKQFSYGLLRIRIKIPRGFAPQHADPAAPFDVFAV